MKRFLALPTLIAAFSVSCIAQTATTDPLPPKANKMYASSSLDGALFSLPFLTVSNSSAIPRFSYFINSGMNFNRDLSQHFGIYTGIGVKNLGYIEKYTNTTGSGWSNSTIKHRVYAIGVPVGIKIGNLKSKGTYCLLGGGIDIPTNYKEKVFTNGRNNKHKFNEWFSDRVNPVMPYIFAGICINSGFTVKLQYYPGNFMNQNYTSNGQKPYEGYESHIGLLSLSYNVKHKSDGKTKAMFKQIFHHNKKES